MSKFSLHLALLACLSTTTLLPACKSEAPESQEQTRQTQSNSRQASQTTTTVSTAQLVSEGLDLSALPEMVKKAKDAEELEEFLNASGVNNLDLNQDDKIDYLNVEEYREDGQRGFLLYTYEDEEQIDIARVSINKQTDTADIVVEGNPTYYGDQARYQSSFPLGQVLLAAWLFNSLTRPPYSHRPYYAGRYPNHYRGGAPVSSSAYRKRASSGAFQAKGQTFSQRATPLQNSQKSLAATQGKSFQSTTQKRPAGSAAQTSQNSSGFGSQSQRSSTQQTRSANQTSNQTSSQTKRTPVKTDNRPRGSSTTSRGSFGSSSNRSTTGSSATRRSPTRRSTGGRRR